MALGRIGPALGRLWAHILAVGGASRSRRAKPRPIPLT